MKSKKSTQGGSDKHLHDLYDWSYVDLAIWIALMLVCGIAIFDATGQAGYQRIAPSPWGTLVMIAVSSIGGIGLIAIAQGVLMFWMRALYLRDTDATVRVAVDLDGWFGSFLLVLLQWLLPPDIPFETVEAGRSFVEEYLVQNRSIRVVGILAIAGGLVWLGIMDPRKPSLANACFVSLISGYGATVVLLLLASLFVMRRHR